MAMQDYTAANFEAGASEFSRRMSASATRENDAMTNLAEQTRLGFLEMKAGADIANDILNQRSVQQQPQTGVIAAAPPISVFKPATT
jgi:hypothetical protein